MSRAARSGVVVSLGLLALSCATTKPRPVVEWPPPPETARVRFVTAFRSGDDLDQSTSRAVLRALVGGNTSVKLERPMGLSVSSDGNRLFIADYGEPRILVADLVAKTLTVFAASELVGRPFGVALDSADNVYVTDQAGHRVVVLKPDGTLLRAFGLEEALVRPAGIAVDSRNKRVYVADPARADSTEHRVLAWDLEGHYVRTLGGPRGQEPGQFNFPMFVAVDAAGVLVVADSLNFRLQLFGLDGQFIRAYGENGVSPGSFSRMKGLDFDGFGNLYVVESEDAVVQIFNADLQALMFFAGNTPALEYLSLPVPIAIDRKRNRIYVGCQVNPRINVYDLVNTGPTDSRTGKPTPEAPSRRQDTNECDLPASIDFGSVARGESVSIPYEYVNQRPTEIHAYLGPVESEQADGAFVISSDSPRGEFVLAAMRSKTATFTFNPTEAREYTATVRMRRADGCPEKPVRLIGSAP